MGTLRIAFLSALVLELAAMLSTGMIAVVLGVRLADGGLRLEDALTVLILAPELHLPLRQLGAQFHSAADGLAAAGRIFELVEVPGEVGRASWSEHVPDPRSSTIRLEGVDFTYPARHNLVLDGVDLELRPGELLALVGPSGVGKSTVAALLLRLVEPTSGRITVGGRDLRDVDVDRWRAGLAWLPQRPHIFAGSVAQNIRIADPSASDDRLLAAVAAAGAAFVHALQQGIDTRIGDGGRPLSAGETRRIGLARALLRDAPLLILDEPTAHLDRESAWSVAASVRQIARGKTTLLITHDEALARLADRAVSIGLPAPGLLEAA
jgi:ABC-type transport system involved in cytochrome bd biosynthesis fused ATPase/permease subunit